MHATINEIFFDRPGNGSRIIFFQMATHNLPNYYEEGSSLYQAPDDIPDTTGEGIVFITGAYIYSPIVISELSPRDQVVSDDNPDDTRWKTINQKDSTKRSSADLSDPLVNDWCLLLR